jgi:pimeloyl-ACP methyl ester carboxylesterase
MAAVLDHLGFDRVRVFGVSGGGPHVLAFAGRHPDRVAAATIVVGMPRLSDEEAEQMIDFNRASYGVARAGDPAALRELLIIRRSRPSGRLLVGSR